jgi:WD40 repeat protein
MVWDLVTKKNLRHWPGEPGKVRTVAFSSDGQLLASVNFELDKQEGRVLSAPATPLGVSFGDAATVAAAGADGKLYLWNIADGANSGPFHYQIGAIRALAFNSVRSQWATGAEDGTIVLWKLPAGEKQLLRGHARWVQAVAYNRAGDALASGYRRSRSQHGPSDR